ncbi:MAG: NfeD family protein, partial [Microbacteriaceae bacterium]|nr:NfeD family protein [Microbacteriaceae bacterium]
LGISALVAAGVGFFVQDWVWTAVAFAGAGLLTLVILRPFGLRAMHRTERSTATNVDALIGASARAIETIGRDSGRIKLRGEEWSARTDLGTIEADDMVTVTKIDGATAHVIRKETA